MIPKQQTIDVTRRYSDQFQGELCFKGILKIFVHNSSLLNVYVSVEIQYYSKLLYIISQIILRLWLVLVYDLIEDRRKDDVHTTKHFPSVFLKWRKILRI